MERCLSHSLASSSGSLARPSRSSAPRLAAAPLRPRVQQRRLRVQAVAEALRPDATLDSVTSVDPMVSPVATVHSPEEFKDVLAANKDRMVVLMCKAMHCRPCKLFSKKYAAAAQQYSDAVFLEIFGDETKDTRKMMIDWKVKVTPTFIIFRGGEKVHAHGGINETQLHRYIAQHLREGEAGFGTFVEPQGADA